MLGFAKELLDPTDLQIADFVFENSFGLPTSGHSLLSFYEGKMMEEIGQHPTPNPVALSLFHWR